MSEQTIFKAVLALQADLKPTKKNAENPYFKSKYTDLANLMKMLQPLLAKHKLGIVQFVTNIDGQSGLKTILIHDSGVMLEADPMPLLLPKNDPQAQGSAITYARRYSIQALLGIVADNDDDGNRATDSMTDDNALRDKKAELYKKFQEKGITTLEAQILKIEDTLGKDTIDTMGDALKVMKALA